MTATSIASGKSLCRMLSWVEEILESPEPAKIGRQEPRWLLKRNVKQLKEKEVIGDFQIPRERFLPFEVLQLSKLRSPFIARFLGATAERSSLYLHMELVDNAFQLEYIAKDGSMWLTDQGLIVKILHQLLGALDCLQKSAVIHRDLTCRNVLLTAAQRVKVIDFNLAVPSPYEQNTMPVGDIHYLAPEVLDGVEQLTCKIDLWSAGIIIIALLRSLPQLDDCEKMAITGFHPLHCCHLRHCHPRLLNILELILQPDQRDRPAPQDLANHCVFQDDIHEILEDWPARPDDGVDDSPDWFPLDDHCSDDDNDGDDEDDDDNDGDDVEATIPPVSMQKSSPEPHPCLTSPSEQPSSSLDQSKALVQIPSTSHTVGDNSNNGPRYGRGTNPCRQGDGLSRGGDDDSQGVKRGRGTRGKDRKVRVQIAASFRVDTTKHKQEQGTGPSSTEIDCGVGDEATTGQECRNDPSLVDERPITQQTHAAEYRTPGEFLGAERGALGAERGALGAEGGAVGGLLGAEGGALRTAGGARRHHGKHHPNVSMGSLADIFGPLEVNEITQTSRLDRGREGHNVLRDHHQQQEEVSDNPTSQATGSNDFKDLCDGPYCYPVDWLYENDDPQATVEERDQSGNRSTAMSSPKMSTGGSSFRGTSQQEASLEMDILVGQLSIDTTAEYQNQILSQFSRESRDGRSSSNSSNQS
ncbi:putative testis-specific serine/threonine kinase [Apostichopus japonicus]|uniref:Putative testis-specific serine/threonine kinase n=1 Tax=Stichopus japonicus TaxID=307972 RepID=A0A2G8KKT5_STIJA|nr:putative testis-specific serine/threonine kinase [Apostichopus japonicus]